MGIKNLVMAAALIGMAASQASAAPFTWTDFDPIGVTLSTPTPYNGNFNISSSDGTDANSVLGYTSGALYDIYATFVFAPSGTTTGNVPANRRRVNIKVGTTDFGATQFTGSSPTVTYISPDLTISTDLEADGQISYTLTRQTKTTGPISGQYSGNLTIVSAQLDAVQDIPDGGSTLALVGAGLMGMAGLARRKTA